MKKVLAALVLIIFSLIFVAQASSIKASDDDMMGSETMMEGRDDALETEVETSGEGENLMMRDDEMEQEMEMENEMDDVSESTLSGRMESVLRKTERLQERINNPEVGEQLQNSVQTQERTQERIESILSDMNARPGFLKFILGPDYKNAGEARSQLVLMRNQINQLTRLKESVDDAESQQQLQEIVDDLQNQSDQLESQLNERLTGFSLFGWLSRMLNGY
jgi:hypothetical protein